MGVIVLTSIGFDCANPLVWGIAPKTPQREDVIFIKWYVILAIAGLLSEFIKSCLYIKYRRKGYIP